MNIKKELTHWLKNPNKNYLGHQDLPNGEDVTLTISTAKWEVVKDPRGSQDSKRVIRFKETSKWIKPFICNETNAKMLSKVTNEKYMENCEGKKIRLTIRTIKVKGSPTECLRVKDVASSLLDIDSISKDELTVLLKQLELANKPHSEFCKAMNIKSISELPKNKFNMCINRLKELSNGNN
jgi:hypothetical protein